MRPKIMVIGSANTDMVIGVEKFPKPGETLLGERFSMNAGGKGANQAVAAARLGADVSFVTKIGTDIFGEHMRQRLSTEGISSECIVIDEHQSSGIALITVDNSGENTIVVAPGANGTLSPVDMHKFKAKFSECEVVCLQLEIPMEAVVYAAAEAARHGTKVILNPAPAMQLSASLWENLYLITPNKSEATILSGVE